MLSRIPPEITWFTFFSIANTKPLIISECNIPINDATVNAIIMIKNVVVVSLWIFLDNFDNNKATKYPIKNPIIIFELTKIIFLPIPLNDNFVIASMPLIEVNCFINANENVFVAVS